ncbi:MAG: hypothetical protein R3F59_07430 [Myxococcota bacterium]
MTLAMLAMTSALANPPRGEVFGGVSGSATQNYTYLTFQPAILRSEDASFVLRATLQHVYFNYLDDEDNIQVDAAGTSFGPGFVFSPGRLSLSMAIGLHAQHATSKIDGNADRGLQLDASLEGNVVYSPWAQAQLYGIFNFSAASPYLWARAGATHAIVPQRTDSSLALRGGLEATSSGTFQARILEVGPVLELAARDIGAVFSVRGGLAVDTGDALRSRLSPSLGAGAYWAF